MCLYFVHSIKGHHTERRSLGTLEDIVQFGFVLRCAIYSCIQGLALALRWDNFAGVCDSTAPHPQRREEKLNVSYILT
jgi:hypothetical protein